MRSAIEVFSGFQLGVLLGTHVVLIAMNCPPEYREGLRLVQVGITPMTRSTGFLA